MISSEEGMAQFVQNIMKSRFALPYEEGRSKVIPLAEAIRQNVEEGMSIHILGLHYRSHAAIYELFRQFWNRQPDFTISILARRNIISRPSLVLSNLNLSRVAKS